MVPRLSPRWRRALQATLVLIVAWFVFDAVRGQWGAVREHTASLSPRWALIVVSALVVLATYAVLIEAWRRFTAASGRLLPFWRAAAIWFISSFGKYVPGKLWSIAAMAAMAQRDGVSPGAATAAAITNQALNVAAGFGVLALAGLETIPLFIPTADRGTALLIVALGATSLLALPLVLPPAVAALARRSGSDVRIARATLWFGVVANLAAWVGYGLAFHLFATALDDAYRASPTISIAAFTGSYLAGYLFLLAPGGLAVREGALIAVLTGAQVCTLPQATLLAFASRLWLTALEITPGAIFLARGALSHNSPSPS